MKKIDFEKALEKFHKTRARQQRYAGVYMATSTQWDVIDILKRAIVMDEIEYDDRCMIGRRANELGKIFKKLIGVEFNRFGEEI